MNADPGIPAQVYTLWWVTLGLTLVVFVPLAVYSLGALLRASRSIQMYARESLEPARAIERSTAALPALDTTISVAGEILAAAEQVAAKLDTIATVLEARAGGQGPRRA